MAQGDGSAVRVDVFGIIRQPEVASYCQALGGEGAKQVKSLMKQARKQGGQLTWTDLVERFPVLSGWLDESFAPPAGEEAG